jgi:hypothetical protein
MVRRASVQALVDGGTLRVKPVAALVCFYVLSEERETEQS